MNIKTVIQIDSLIKRMQTGVPKHLALKLNLSERAVYKYLKFMKEELNAPIEFSKMHSSYYYMSAGQFSFKWKKN